ncbi:OprD family porin [Pseudoxanthomonas daejeonensis]|uniref:OprD family outer membrane porin n=1 Tax=Pseudoxanthomonas daejeonensis TaxID=266062 RepID=UPI001F541E43|nr:OprD family outer membrane porin [Pseudoxanthomonas daejeonensis]UNK56354.1 OprD family porin [Pseudoxanthomonas daejeonensis]
MDIRLNPKRRHRGSALLVTTAGCLLAGSLAAPGLAFAQAAPQEPVREELEALDDMDLAPNSVEQGQTPLDQSFGPSRQEWIRETRRKAFEDTKFDVQARTFYLDRDKYDNSEMEAWALGGSAGLKTGYFREIFAFGATGYTSQKLYGPDDKDGTGLLAPGQEGYTVLGEVYGEFLLNQDTRLTLGRRAFDTPYINKNDARMTPNTFQAAVVQGLYGDKDSGEWRVGGGYVDKIKERTSEDFVSMAKDAGAPAGVERGVYTAGANYALGDLSVGAIGYYSDDIIGIFYTEAKYAFALSDDWKLRTALQYSDQSSNGDQLLKGRSFDSNQWGAKAEVVNGGALFTVAYTDAGGNANMQNPWSGYPGYTSVQVEDFNRDGESAWMVRAGYDFASVKGLGVYALYVDGSDPASPTDYAREEADFNVQWKASEGVLKGLMVRLRYAQVSQADPASDDLKDLRIMVFYDPPSL